MIEISKTNKAKQLKLLCKAKRDIHTKHVKEIFLFPTFLLSYTNLIHRNLNLTNYFSNTKSFSNFMIGQPFNIAVYFKSSKGAKMIRFREFYYKFISVNKSISSIKYLKIYNYD